MTDKNRKSSKKAAKQSSSSVATRPGEVNGQAKPADGAASTAGEADSAESTTAANPESSVQTEQCKPPTETADNAAGDKTSSESQPFRTDVTIAQGIPVIKPEALKDRIVKKADEGQTPAEPLPIVSPSSSPSDTAPAEASAPTRTYTRLKLLNDVLEEEPPPLDEPHGKRRLRYPIFADFILAAGLLVAVAGFTLGFFKLLMSHNAQQCMAKGEYETAIRILRSDPLPHYFNMAGSNPEEQLSEAMYLDAMKKIDEQNDLNGALKELEKIPQGSRFGELAQDILRDNFVPSSTTLQGGLQQDAAASAAH